jgi:hypothetical protein
MRRLVATLIATIALLAGSGTTTARAALESADEADIARAKFFFEGFWTAVEVIRTGVVTVTEVDLSWNKANPGPNGTPRTELFWAFDNETGNVRFDFTRGGRKTQFARNAKESLLWLPKAERERTVSRFPRDYKVTVHDAQPVDFRSVALTLHGAYRNKWSADQVREYCNDLTNATLTQLEEAATTVTLEYDWGKFEDNSPMLAGRTKVIFDRREGSLPVLIEEGYQWKGKEGEWITETRTETQWKELSGVWVPHKCKLAAVRNPHALDLSLDWASVNGVVASDLFEMVGLDAPPTTLVLNHKLGESVSEGRLGDVLATEEAQEQESYRLSVLVVVALVAPLIMAIGMFVWRKPAHGRTGV